MMRCFGQHHSNLIAGLNFSSSKHDAHDSAFSDQLSRRCTLEYCLRQTLLIPVELFAGVAQAGHLYDCGRTDVQLRISWQRKNIDTNSGDVLPERPRIDCETLRAQLIKKFCMNQVNLAEIRLGRVCFNSGSVLDGLPGVSISVNP